MAWQWFPRMDVLAFYLKWYNVGCLYLNSMHAGKVGPVWVLNVAFLFCFFC